MSLLLLFQSNAATPPAVINSGASAGGADDSGWIGYDEWREGVLAKEEAEKRARESSEFPLATRSTVSDEDTGDEGGSVPESKVESVKSRTLRTSRRKPPLRSTPIPKRVRHLSLLETLERFNPKTDPVEQYFFGEQSLEHPAIAKKYNDDEILIAVAEGANPEDIAALCSS